jgi:REP element-mobilizing transposase RayT
MRYDPDKHHRRSIRLKGYDYAQTGAYFVTICTQGHVCLFGEIANRSMMLNEAGQMVESWWNELPRKFTFARLDSFIIMPNHIHGIIVFVEADVLDIQRAHTQVRPYKPVVGLGRVMQWFKTMTTNAYIRGVRESGWSPFQKRLWQRDFYDHIVRDEDDLNRVREYIVYNPLRWPDDPDHPNNIST